MSTEGKKTELKVKAATWAAFAVDTVALVWLSTTATDFVKALPDWVEVPAYSLIATAAVFLAGRQAKNRPEALSDSTLQAAEKRLRDRLTRKPSVDGAL